MHRVPAGFRRPDFARPLDVEATVAALPLGGAIKGMYLQAIADLCAKSGKTLSQSSFTAFKDYPLALQTRLGVEAAQLMHPDVPVREGLRRIGRTTYGVLSSTLIGRVVFGVLGRDIAKVTPLAAKAYDVSGRGLDATVIEQGDGFSHIRLEGHACLIDSFHVGAFEGVLDFCGVDGEVFLHEVGPTTTDLFTIWQPRAG
ncbi:MAG TPA: DUF2378 family protein [Myxococcota bacterium]